MRTPFHAPARELLSACRNRIVPVLTAALLVGGTAACSDDSPSGLRGTAGVRILMTDAPTDMLDSAWVWISHVYLTGPGGTEVDDEEVEGEDDSELPGGRMDLFLDEENPVLVDLLTLQDGVTVDLTGVVPVEATTWEGVRFVVDSTRLVLAEGYTFEDVSTVGTFKVPSGRQTGIKVKLDDILDLDEDEVTTVLIDFPVNDNFRIQMHPQLDTVVRRVTFQPVLRELGRDDDSDESGDDGSDG